MSEAKRKAAVEAAKELAQLYPVARNIKVRMNVAEPGNPPQFVDRDVAVDEMEITQLAHVTRLIHEITDKVDFDTVSSLVDIVVMAAEHDKEMINAVSIAIGIPADEVARFSSSSFLEVALAVFETNRDFFARRLGRHASAVMGMFTTMKTQPGQINGAGSTPSPSSDSTAESSTPNVSH